MYDGIDLCAWHKALIVEGNYTLQQLNFFNYFYFSLSQNHMGNHIYYLNFSFYMYKYMHYVIFLQRIEFFILEIIQSFLLWVSIRCLCIHLDPKDFCIHYILVYTTNILAINFTCIKGEIKKFETYLDDLVLPMVNYSWLVHNINTDQWTDTHDILHLHSH